MVWRKWNVVLFINGGNGKWWGFAGIVNQDITDSFGLALRGEYFDDNDGARLGVNGLRCVGSYPYCQYKESGKTSLSDQRFVMMTQIMMKYLQGSRESTHNSYWCCLYVLSKLLLLFKTKASRLCKW